MSRKKGEHLTDITELTKAFEGKREKSIRVVAKGSLEQQKLRNLLEKLLSNSGAIKPEHIA